MGLVTEVRNALADRHALQLTEEQIVRLAEPPRDPQKLECWLNFILKLIETGNIHEAVMGLLKCLMEQGLLQQAEPSRCFLDFILGLIKGGDMPTLLLNLVFCLLGKQPPGQLEPPAFREVDRCS